MALAVKNYELPNFGSFNGSQARLVGLTALPEISSSSPWTLSKISYFANKLTTADEDLSSASDTALLLVAGYFDNSGSWDIDKHIVVSYNIEISPTNEGFVAGTGTVPGGSIELDFGDATGPFFLALFANANDADGWLSNRELSLSTFLQRDA
jgi:hypothetical protein